jgi:hypothetical protein
MPEGPAAPPPIPEGPAPPALPLPGGLGNVIICPEALTSGRFRYGGSYLGMVLFLLFVFFNKHSTEKREKCRRNGKKKKKKQKKNRNEKKLVR